MKSFLLTLVAITAFASIAAADSVGTYGAVTIVTGPDNNPAWQLTSDTAGMGYGGVYLQVTNPLTPTSLFQLSAAYVMTSGTFGPGAPRFTIFDTNGNSAYVYWGTPQMNGSFTDPNNGNTSYGNTGNYADLSSSQLRVESNGFGGFNSGTFPFITWNQFVSNMGVAGSQIAYITIDLDAGFAGTQVMELGSFTINGVTYAPAGVPDSGTTALMLGLGLMGIAAVRRKRLMTV